jgi:hypothetical protein
MVDDNNHEIVYFGPDNTGTQVIGIRREGGANVLYTFTTDTGRQFWALTDNGGRIIASDDAKSGQGLARPYVPLPFHDATWETGFAKTSSTTWTTVAECRSPRQHPVVSMTLRAAATVGSIGQYRVVSDGQVVRSGELGNVVDSFTFPVPGEHMSGLDINVDLRITSGTGSAGAMVREAHGVQS